MPLSSFCARELEITRTQLEIRLVLLMKCRFHRHLTPENMNSTRCTHHVQSDLLRAIRYFLFWLVLLLRGGGKATSRLGKSDGQETWRLVGCGNSFGKSNSVHGNSQEGTAKGSVREFERQSCALFCSVLFCLSFRPLSSSVAFPAGAKRVGCFYCTDIVLCAPFCAIESSEQPLRRVLG